MFRRLLLTSFIVLSLLLWYNVSSADESDNSDIRDAMDFAENKADAVDYEIDDLGLMQDAMKVLIAEWNGNKSDIVNGIELTLVGVLGTTASVAANIFSGGAFTLTTKTAALFTLKQAIDVGMSISAHSGYVDAMESAINAVDEQITEIEKAKVVYSEIYDDKPDTYNGAYERYLELLATHTGFNAEDIDERVNTSDIDDDKFEHKISLTPTHKHFGDERREFTYESLLSDQECDGPCNVMFRSPYKAFKAHRTECGTGDDIGIVSIWDIAELQSRPIGQGCGHKYYKCPGHLDREGVQKHEIRTCTKGYVAENGTKGPCLDSDREPLKYRKCMYWEQDHNARIWGISAHSDDGSDDEANAGGTDVMHACNIHDTSVPGDHSSTWLCNESPCSNLQVPYCLAICPETGNHGTATTPMHVCEVHELWQSGDHSRITPVCGVSDHAGDACQIDVSHETSVSCPQENGVSCSYENYYTCSPHTHAYPAATTVTAPVWSDIPDPYNLTVGDSFTLDLNSYVTGSPTITRNGGVIPAGLSFRNGIVSGRVSRVESRSFRFTATNAAGSTVSEWVNITVEAAQ